MRLHPPLRTLSILLATVLIFFPLAGQAAEAKAPHHAKAPRLTAVGFIAKILFPSLANYWEKAGCEIDPSGRFLAPPVINSAGCEIDPNGRCLGGH